ncbi:zinc finger protein 280D isoform X2 [Eublepharis macularius]|uniref:Zinc finger protein 280D isoform X2 n=1 Tax=Eublepharis macularius TaxID=481883 RepID=A0AA97KN55_EUBMA|nr:zinc finger protein 280D isoform X2 [Eublepharis macularius]
MAELFMECEEEELEPWQQKMKPIIVDDDDDDDEPIFVGEILSSKPANTYILNRVNPGSPRMAMQNGTPKKGLQTVARPATSTLAVQPQPRMGSLSGTSAVLQKPLPGGSSSQEAAKPGAGISQPVSRSTPTSSVSRNLPIPAVAQSAARPVATVTAQPAPPSNTSSMVFGLRQSPGAPQGLGGAAVTSAGLSKRPATSEVNSISSKKAKGDETGSESNSPVSPAVKSPHEMSSLQKGTASCHAKNGAPFPQACPKCNIHFNLLDPLKNHMKYCCPDMVHTFLGTLTTDCSGGSTKIAETERGKLIMLVNDFYYGKYDGDAQQVRQEQKTHTTFKCASCTKLLKNNIRFMNHMKHHLELEKQNSESWESHTTCQHCFRQFPTPFQLQCHIESTHTPYESSTICRICELSFETEQILLQHMKDNHKPGEMPYVCQVCSYRSSSFSDVEKHFRAVHENTKNLLCPFCLKVIKIGAPYMHHYMRHQKKGVHRCTKCRLQFLTCKEKMDHKSQHHRTFRKPVQLEGLPPGTKVTIRASLGSLQPGSAATPFVSTSTSTLQLSPNVKMTNAKNHNKLNVNKAKPKLKPLSVQKKQSLGTSSLNSGSGSSGGSGGSGSSNKRNTKIANTALSSLRCSGTQKCVECSSGIRTFASHFPAYVHCSLCRYGTSCSKAYVNHMASFHSARQSKRFWIYKARSEELRGITTVCLNCDFLTDDSGLDKMATHLNESQTHTCQVIVESAASEDVATEKLSERMNDTPLINEGEDKTQSVSTPNTPEGPKGTSAPASPERKNSAEEANNDQLYQGDETSLADKCEGKASPSTQENASSPAFAAPPKDHTEEGEKGSLGGQMAESEDDASPSVCGPSSGLGVSEDPTEGGDADRIGNRVAEGSAAAECGENSPPSVLEHSSGPGLSACSEDSRKTAEEGRSLSNWVAEGASAVDGGENPPHPVPEHSPSPGLAAHSEDLQEGNADCPGDPLAESSAADDCEGKASVAERSSGPGLSACPESPGASAEEADGCGSPMGGGCKAGPGGANVAPCTPEPASSPGLSAHSKDPREAVEEAKGDASESGVQETPSAVECVERTPAPVVVEVPSAASLQAPLKDSAEATAKDSPGDRAAECEGSSSALTVGDSAKPGVQPCSVEMPLKGAGGDGSGTGDHPERTPRKPRGEESSQSSDDQPKASDLEEAGLEDLHADPSEQASDGDVSFEQFLRRRDEPESVSSDVSEQGSVHLEPLTPSEVLEHEATEILQKGGSAPSSTKTSGPGSEQAEAATSGEGSPSHVEAVASQAEESEEAS